MKNNFGTPYNSYIGHESQLYGVEEHRLVGGKGDGMRLLQVKNGKGLEFTVSADRCADISRLSFRGVNMGFFSPCGYAAPAYYDKEGNGFLKSFTAGFLTTCGLTQAGAACIDEGEVLPLHGNISHMPAEHIYWEQDKEAIHIHAMIPDEVIFAHKLILRRELICSLQENQIILQDTVQNRGDIVSPVMILYHMNLGYPLLSEKAKLKISSTSVQPRDSRAAEDFETWMKILPPQENFTEQCYFHRFAEKGCASLYNPEIGQGLEILFDPQNLPFLTEWKMMGIRDYVLGLEPGNCNSMGRSIMRQEGCLRELAPGEEVTYRIIIRMLTEQN